MILYMFLLQEFVCISKNVNRLKEGIYNQNQFNGLSPREGIPVPAFHKINEEIGATENSI